MERILFNRPHSTGAELGYIQQAMDNGHLSGRGPFGARCSDWLECETGARRALLTSSCTSALEMAALLARVGPGDEVIMPSFTFVSTANAIALRGATPVFVDIRPDTLNLDESAVADAISPRTRAIAAVHYAGVGCDMDALHSLTVERGLTLIEDAAQGALAAYRGRSLGSIGQLGCLSFHETKNVHCGEGGALLVNDPELVARAEVVQEKGTNRTDFTRGRVDKYTWVALGSSYLTSEVNAAFLWAQLEHAHEITARRLEIWEGYHRRFAELESLGVVRRPVVPADCSHNAHMYYLLVEDRAARDRLITELERAGIQAVFHYVPLHSSPAGRALGRPAGALPVTDRASACLVRLPLWPDMTEEQIEHVAASTVASLT